MRVVAYTRVSTDGQAVLGASLEAQRTAIEGECARRGWHLLGIEREAQSSVKRRPVFEHCLERMDAGAFDVLMVSRMDRAFRSQLDFITTMARAEREGWMLVMLDPAVDMSTPYGRAMAGMAAVFAQLERELISQRTRDGIAAKRAAGEYRGGRVGNPPEVPDDVVERIMRHAGQRSSREIARLLDLAGVPAPRGDSWSDRTVRKVIARSRELADAA